MLRRLTLYRLASAVELITGVALVLSPNLAIEALFQAQASGAEPQLTQLYGLALIALGATCWKQPCPHQAQRGMAIYNNLAGIFLLSLILKGLCTGLVVWTATVLHLSLGLVMIKDQQQKD